jgi:hypothetical protein
VAVSSVEVAIPVETFSATCGIGNLASARLDSIQTRPQTASYPNHSVQNMTPLDKPLRRQFALGETVYTITIDPSGLKVVQKGHRKGVELTWAELVSGDAGIAAALQASVERL